MVAPAPDSSETRQALAKCMELESLSLSTAVGAVLNAGQDGARRNAEDKRQLHSRRSQDTHGMGFKAKMGVAKEGISRSPFLLLPDDLTALIVLRCDPMVHIVLPLTCRRIAAIYNVTISFPRIVLCVLWSSMSNEFSRSGLAVRMCEWCSTHV